MKKFLIVAAALLLSPTTAGAAVVGETVNYTIGGNSYSGYLAYDDAIEGKRPGILVLHEWWGHDDYVKGRTKMLARMGYTAFSPDMYGSGKLASHPKDAKAFMTAMFSSGEVGKRMGKAASLLKNHATVDKDKLGAIGYCMGGALALGAARNGMDLKAVASFHGSLATKSKAKPGAVKAELLVMNGADDSFVKAEHISAFKAEMNSAGARYTFVNYPGAVHSFTNPAATERGRKFGIPLRYNAEAEQDSWRRMQVLFNTAFK